jgi:putative transposase
VSTELAVPLARVCRVLGAPRSTAHYRRRHLRLVTDGGIGERPGPVVAVDDTTLVGLIRRVLTDSPFCGEGYRKVRARLRRDHGVYVSGKRVLRLMRREGLLAPQRAHRRRSRRLHEGSIIPDAPNLRWGTDATMAWTVDDGWVWVFDLVDHYTAEAWAHVAKVGDRFAALQPGLRRRHRPPRHPRPGRRPRPGGAPRLGIAVPLRAFHRLAGLVGNRGLPGVPR